MSPKLCDPELYDTILKLRESIIDAYVQRDYARAIRLTMDGADQVNQYIDTNKPWLLAKDPDKLLEVQAICTMGLNLFRILMTYLKPVLPDMALAAEAFLNCEPLMWDSIDTPLLDHTISTFVPLMTRVEREKIDAMLGVSS